LFGAVLLRFCGAVTLIVRRVGSNRRQFGSDGLAKRGGKARHVLFGRRVMVKKKFFECEVLHIPAAQTGLP
jgi:hypothetical protein